MTRQVNISRESGITRVDEQPKRNWLGRLVALCLLGLLLLWLGIPALRVGLLFARSPIRHAPAQPADLRVEAVSFPATDGVALKGWFVPAASHAPTIILIAGFKADRASMVPYALFLHAAGFNALLYDSRGTGASGGTFSLGLREVKDVAGAVAYLNRRAGLRHHRYGLLGVSLGAGIAIVAASSLLDVRAVVADSPYTDQHLVVQHLDNLHLGPLNLPLAPIGPRLVNRVLGAPLDSFSPLHSVRKIRALLLIHSRHDQNPTTPLHATMALYHAAGGNARLWIAPKGGHADALAAQPVPYSQHVVGFFRRYLR